MKREDAERWLQNCFVARCRIFERDEEGKQKEWEDLSTGHPQWSLTEKLYRTILLFDESIIIIFEKSGFRIYVYVREGLVMGFEEIG